MKWRPLLPLPRNIFQHFQNSWKENFDRLGKEISIELATTRGDLEACHLLLMNNEFFRGNAFKPYYASYQLLQTTCYILAKKNNEPVAVILLAKDGVLGVPSDKLYDLSLFRKFNERISEVIGIAVANEKIEQSIPFILHLFKYTLLFIKKVNYADVLILPSFPHLVPYWENLFFVKNLIELPLTDRNNESKGYYLKLIWTELFMNDPSAGKNSSKHELSFLFSDKEVSGFRFPSTQFYKSFNSTLTPEYFKHILNNNKDIAQFMDDEDLYKIYLYYLNSIFEPIIKTSLIMNAYHIPHRRRNQRFEVICRGVIIDEFHNFHHADLIDASEYGIGIILDQQNTKLKIGQVFKGVFEVGPQLGSQIEFSIARFTDNHRYGAFILKRDHIWDNFIGYLNEDFNHLGNRNQFKKIS